MYDEKIDYQNELQLFVNVCIIKWK